MWKYIFILIIGVLLGYFSCDYYLNLVNHTIEFHGPNSNEIKKWIYHDPNKDKYYKFHTIPYVCPPLLMRKIMSLNENDLINF